MKIRFSYPCPTLTDWGRRCDHEEQPWTSIPQLELELGLAVTLEVDPAAKRIRVRAITPFLPLNVPEELKNLFAQLQGAVQQIFAAVYGAGWVQGAVASAINAAIPIRLPEQWDVSRLTVARENIIVNGVEVWGVELALRYEEHLFN